jgi:hypothetical protein
MRTYSNYASGKDIMPLMMNFTSPSPISISEPVSFTYSDAEQINYEMRIVGTRSLRSSLTNKSRGIGRTPAHVTDRKNEIDDSKSVR